MWLRFGVGDFFAGLSSLYALLLGLYERNRSGVGQMVSSSLLGATLLSMSEAVVLEDGSLTRRAVDGSLRPAIQRDPPEICRERTKDRCGRICLLWHAGCLGHRGVGDSAAVESESFLQ